MKKINAQFHTFLLLAAPALTLLATTNAQKTEYILTAAATVPSAVGGCNATRTVDCLADKEFLMESEISRRLIVDGPNTVTYKTFDQTRDFCDANVYGSCVGKDSKSYNKRKCDLQNNCDCPGS